MQKLNNTYRLMRTLVVMLVLGASIPAKAELTCPDAGLLSGKLLTDVCWSCIFPIRVAGLPLGSGNVPSGASNKSFCLCEDNLGVPRPGIVTSMWEPARLIELVRTPGCSPSLGGIRLPLGDRRLQGGHGEGEYDTGDLAFYHYHYYAFPLLVMLDLFMDGNCNADGYMDFDLMYLSELDPTWLNDELAFLLSLKRLPLPIHWLYLLVPLTLPHQRLVNPSTSCFGVLAVGGISIRYLAIP
ncbi:hypothetical protein ACOMICROBIO_EPCKBFOG_01861 [Vibrio sp. B1FLJ16]|nr:hypothetical protein ACOMICROBIO_EPCKBFOG_01861 [Vibrio sp. B1FLJ16]CAE6908558.1 hypothetical protein ACOMICROBIO_EPCKBFOG_01861 [Vibrio sp. B1FLJ16]